jgi:triosephosphate isomerase (TIM)
VKAVFHCVKNKLDLHKNKIMRKNKIIAGNWKMNTNIAEASNLVNALKNVETENTVILCVPFTHISIVQSLIGEKSHFHVGAQNMHQLDKGAYTGEISAEMLVSLEISYVIIGHSERREYFKESNELLMLKVNKAIEKGMTPIFCCGESLKTRESGKQVNFVKKQIKDSLFHLDAENLRKVIIAYEPIWAIGTGVTASPEQAQDMHYEIRKAIKSKYGKRVAESIPILYGGSVTAATAKELFSKADIDGGLVGGASLKVEDFKVIMQS